MPTPHTRLLSGILTVLTTASIAGCSDHHDERVSYRPGDGIGDRGDLTWPELPCVPGSDARLKTLASDCGAEDLVVTAGPSQEVDDAGETVCRYRISYNTPAGQTCVTGRPLVDEDGVARTATLVRGVAWSNDDRSA